jgi:hypothetical protein
MPSVALIWADGGYGGPQLLGWARRVLHVSMQIVRKPLGIPTFHVLPRARRLVISPIIAHLIIASELAGRRS